MSRIIYTPEAKKKKNVSLKKFFWGAALFLLIIIILSGAIYLSRLSAIQISKLEISGNIFIEKQDIESKVKNLLEGLYFSFIPKKNYFLVRPKNIEKNILKEFLRVEEAIVHKEPFNGIKINVREREPWAIYCSQKCFFMDKSGFAYEEAFMNSGNLIRFIKTDDEKLPLGEYIIANEIIKIALARIASAPNETFFRYVDIIGYLPL